MSGEVTGTPVAKYGKSCEFGVVLDFIQSMISNDTLRKAFNFPHLVLVGRQKHGKDHPDKPSDRAISSPNAPR